MASDTHRLRLSEEFWLWRFVALRSAGFPLECVERLACPRTAAELDEASRRERVAEAARLSVERALLSTSGADDDARRRETRKALKRVRANGLPERSSALPPEVVRALEEWRAAKEHAESALARARAAFEGEDAECAESVAAVFRDTRMFEALVWQNRTAARTFGGHLGRHEGALRSKDRRHVRQAATYIQRYVLKNDSIGFFGPVAWTTIAPDRSALEVAPGPKVARRISTYFEHWAIDLLARALSQDEELKSWLTVRRLPHVLLDGREVVLPGGERGSLTPIEAGVLAQADGVRTATEIAEALGADTRQSLDAIAALETRGLVRWGIEVPLGHAGKHPERALADAARRIPVPELRARIESVVQRIEAARKTVDDASGDAEALQRALDRADEIFTTVTGASASRAAGEQFAGRSILFSDGVRDVDVTLGDALFEKLRAPMELVLLSHRWFAHEVARGYAEVIDRVFDSVSTGDGPVPYTRFWEAFRPLASLPFVNEPPPFVADVVRAYEAKWADVLRYSTERRREQYRASELRPAVLEAFAAPHSGVDFCRFSAPDLMIAAPSVEAVNRGEMTFVIGEIHGAGSPLLNSWLLCERDSPDDLLNAYTADSGRRHVRFVLPEGTPAARLFPKNTPGALYVEHDGARADAPREDVVATSDLEILREAGGLVVRRIGSGERWSAVDFHESLLQLAILRAFKGIIGGLPHAPRITIDDLVVSRERWTLPTTDLAFAGMTDPFERFVAARRWQVERGLPRHCFVKLKEERKPYYVDFDSALLLEVLSATARKCSEATFTEMLPDPTQCWLVDANGRRYTSELRTMMVDARPTRDARW